MKLDEVRTAFLDFFKDNGHTIAPSSSLVPDSRDTTLLFTNAGMVQFKNVFIGKECLSYDTAASAQRCLRAGGKHNDLENVGYTSRHHTFFEMLGNFSFGSYFKEEAITYAWSFLIDFLRLEISRLWVTVYFSDDQTYNIWRDKIKIPEDRIIRIGNKNEEAYTSDNFWQMATTGPCGPCTEIFYDHGPSVAGGPPGSPSAEGDRFVEIWNIVFMEFDLGSDSVLRPLPKPCVDTGMGLERISAVMQGVSGNYDIDLFRRLISAIESIVGLSDSSYKSSFRVIADHIRSTAFLIFDGVIPGNEGRYYVLRRIIRRAIRHGYQLNQRSPFFYKLLPELVSIMGDAYPELKTEEERIASEIRDEEERFFETIANGMVLLERELSKNISILDGSVAFKLYDTFGFPLDLTEDVCKSRNIYVDTDGFDRAMAAQRENARSHSCFGKNFSVFVGDEVRSNFCGYDTSKLSASILAIYVNGQLVPSLLESQEGVIVCDKTPFYPEGGGPVGDTGKWYSEDLSSVFNVTDTQNLSALVIAHFGFMSKGTCKTSDIMLGEVNLERRMQIARHHSATHLLNSALRKILGTHVKQRGSYVDEHKLRFDFSHRDPISEEQLSEISNFVNDEVMQSSDTKICFMPYREAINSGAISLSSDKYEDVVRVLQIGSSRELCGGIHVKNTGNIGLFAITCESAVSSGVRRIEAVAGFSSLRLFYERSSQIQKISKILSCKPVNIIGSISKISDKLITSQKLLEQVKNERLLERVLSYKNKCCLHNDVKIFLIYDDKLEKSDAVFCVNYLSKDYSPSIVIFITNDDSCFNLIFSVSNTISHVLDARSIAKDFPSLIIAKGGGRANLAQYRVHFPDGISTFFDKVFLFLTQQLDKIV
ncbi:MULTISPECIES: alanine--tRNA ligase [Candidatus Ichthyocystis]|uniref:alanine--tRNA ligase n=1 Tax=Candidatus Ichthyocystis TaxID=2929841 RepID=UPI000ABEC395|nr:MULTISPECIES: alanine--tRNA ligase [Ichthyocystis]